MVSNLPSPKASQAYMDVSVLEAGHLALPEHILVKDGSPTKFNMLPCISFLLRHSSTDKKVIFDLGLRKDWENYPPAVVKMVKHVFGGPVEIPVDAVGALRNGGLDPENVDAVILSHVHFDHIGDPSLFPTSQFIVGGESKGLLEKGYSPDNPESAPESHFARGLLPDSRTSYLSYDGWTPIGPFPRAHDFFGDGSVYLIDASGHLPGHLNALVRTSSDGSWVFLAGDSAHDVRIITGEREIGMFPNPFTGALVCMHHDLDETKRHIGRIQQVKALGRVEVLLAHDIAWFEENRGKDVTFPGKIKPL